MKPKLVYKGRMKAYADCDKWLIWSNKWSCWYKPESRGYTTDITCAGVFTYDEAMTHYTPTKYPKSYRVVEPFPIICVKNQLRNEIRELEEKSQKLKDMLSEI